MKLYNCTGLVKIHDLFFQCWSVLHWGTGIRGLMTLTFDLESGSKSRVTWATSVPILVFLGLSVLDLGLMYATDRFLDFANFQLAASFRS